MCACLIIRNFQSPNIPCDSKWIGIALAQAKRDERKVRRKKTERLQHTSVAATDNTEISQRAAFVRSLPWLSRARGKNTELAPLHAQSPYRNAHFACNVVFVDWLTDWLTAVCVVVPAAAAAFFLVIFHSNFGVKPLAYTQSKCDVLRPFRATLFGCLCAVLVCTRVFRLLIRLIFCSRARFSFRFERVTNSSTHTAFHDGVQKKIVNEHISSSSRKVLNKIEKER